MGWIKDSSGLYRKHVPESDGGALLRRCWSSGERLAPNSNRLAGLYAARRARFAGGCGGNAGVWVDLSTHRARRVERADLQAAALILTMTAGHKEQLVADYPEVRDKVHVLREFVAAQRQKRGGDGQEDRSDGGGRTYLIFLIRLDKTWKFIAGALHCSPRNLKHWSDPGG